MKHELKIEENYLKNLIEGRKKAEIRLNDRDYQKDDILIFKEYLSNDFIKHAFKITHVHSGLGLKDGYVALSLKGITEY